MSEFHLSMTIQILPGILLRADRADFKSLVLEDPISCSDRSHIMPITSALLPASSILSRVRFLPIPPQLAWLVWQRTEATLSWGDITVQIIGKGLLKYKT